MAKSFFAETNFLFDSLSSFGLGHHENLRGHSLLHLVCRRKATFLTCQIFKIHELTNSTNLLLTYSFHSRNMIIYTKQIFLKPA